MKDQTLGAILASPQVIVIGGGPTGLVAALNLARRQIPVTVLERKDWPVDKVCGEGLMPSGVEILRRLGVLEHLSLESEKELHYFPFKGIRYIDPSGAQAEAEFLSGSGMGIRRLHLSQALLKAVQKNPFITLCPNTEFVDFEQLDQQVWVKTLDQKTKLKGRLGPFTILLGCDGLHSRVRKLSNLNANPPGKQKRIGSRVHFAMRPWSDKVEVWWEKGIEAYITPNSSDQIEVAFIWDHDQVNPQLRGGPFSFFPELQKKLLSQKRTSNLQSIGPLAQRALKAVNGQVVLLGDALLFLDGITGEGLSMGFAQGELFADLLASSLEKAKKGILSNPFAEFEKQVSKQMQNYLRMTHLALFLTRHPKIRKWSIQLLAIFPTLFQHLLEVNMGKRSLLKILMPKVLPWRQQNLKRGP